MIRKRNRILLPSAVTFFSRLRPHTTCEKKKLTGGEIRLGIKARSRLYFDNLLWRRAERGKKGGEGERKVALGIAPGTQEDPRLRN